MGKIYCNISQEIDMSANHFPGKNVGDGALLVTVEVCNVLKEGRMAKQKISNGLFNSKTSEGNKQLFTLIYRYCLQYKNLFRKFFNDVSNNTAN